MRVVVNDFITLWLSDSKYKNAGFYLFFSFLTSFVVVGIYAYLMKDAITADPIFDEIWKLDVVTAPSVFERIPSLNSIVAPGWAYVAKGFMWMFPDHFYASRIFTAIWILPVIFLIPLCFTSVSQEKISLVILLCGAAYIALSNPIQSAVTYFNPYTFEMFYSVLLLFLCSRWDIFSQKGKWVTLLFLSLTPFFTFSTLFYLPFLYSMIFLSSDEKKLKNTVMFSAVITLAISATLYFYIYAAAKSPYMLSFWDGYLAVGSITRLFQILADFPGQMVNSLASFQFLPFIAQPLGSSLLIIMFGFILLGIRSLYKVNARITMAMLSASIVACMLSYLTPWPLSFNTPLNRVNLAILWPFYFAFGIGVSQLIRSLLPKIFHNKQYVYFIFLFAILPPLNTYPFPAGKDRQVFTDIVNAISPDDKKKSIVFTVHYSTDSYANYLLANRFPDQFVTVNIGHENVSSEYLKNMQIIVADQKGIDLAYIVLPVFILKQEIMNEVNTFTFPGFILDKITETESSQIRKFKKIEEKHTYSRGSTSI